MEMIKSEAGKLFKCIACHGRVFECYDGEKLVKKKDDGNHDPRRCNRVRILNLACSFHGLRHAAGLVPWDPQKLAKWVRSGGSGHGSRCAARFVLMVSNSSAFDKKGLRFDLAEAMGCWDDSHRAAFQAWVASPWWA